MIKRLPNELLLCLVLVKNLFLIYRHICDNNKHTLPPQNYILRCKFHCFVPHCRDSYRPFALVIRPSNSSVAPGAAVVSVMAGMGSDWALGRQKRLTGMLPGWTRGADCDPWVSRCSSTWAGSSSWERWAGWHWVGSKWEGWSNQLILTYLVGCSWWFGCYMSVYTHFVRPGAAQRWGSSPNREETLLIYMFFKLFFFS